MTYDDAVVGAGIMGLAHAYQLAKRGRKVIVFERTKQAQGASIRNFGMLWPIGQPAGSLLNTANRSVRHWHSILQQTGLWHDRVGSLHVAYQDDEAAVLQEFTSSPSAEDYSVELLTPQQAKAKSPGLRSQGLKAALWSENEICVDPRQVIRELPTWLNQTLGITFQFNQLVTGYSSGKVHTCGNSFEISRLWVCSGDDLQTLYPNELQKLGLIRCKLQMMRTQVYGDSFKLGPMLAAGLTLCHYKAFQHCPSLPILKARYEHEYPQHLRYGIHVLASQQGSGEVSLGDSHEYGDDISIFNKDEIDELVLRYLSTFLELPAMKIASRWHGIYIKHPTLPWTIIHPEPNVTCITGVGGNGMTLSFGMAEDIVRQNLE